MNRLIGIGLDWIGTFVGNTDGFCARSCRWRARCAAEVSARRPPHGGWRTLRPVTWDGKTGVMQLSQTEQRILRELVDALRRDFGASEVLLHGSAARGQLQEGSDIDLLLVLPQLSWEIEKEVIEYCFRAELKCGRVISAVCFSRDELNESALRVSPFVLHARKEGIAL